MQLGNLAERGDSNPRVGVFGPYNGLAKVQKPQALLFGINNLRRMKTRFSGKKRLVREQLFPSCSPTTFWCFHIYRLFLT